MATKESFCPFNTVLAGSLSLRSPSAHLNNLLCGVASNYVLGGIFQPLQNGTKRFDKDAAKAVDSKWMSQVLNKCHVEGPVYSRCGEVLNKQGAAGLGVFCTMWGRHDDRWHCHTGHTLQTTPPNNAMVVCCSTTVAGSVSAIATVIPTSAMSSLLLSSGAQKASNHMPHSGTGCSLYAPVCKPCIFAQLNPA